MYCELTIQYNTILFIKHI